MDKPIVHRPMTCLHPLERVMQVYHEAGWDEPASTFPDAKWIVHQHQVRDARWNRQVKSAGVKRWRAWFGLFIPRSQLLTTLRDTPAALINGPNLRCYDNAR